MKKYFLVLLVIIGLLALAGIGFAKGHSGEVFSVQHETSKITVEQARKIALKRVEGTIEDEYTLEDDEGEIDTYVFIVKNKQGKTFEVQIEAGNGDVVSVEEYTDYEDDEDPPHFAIIG